MFLRVKNNLYVFYCVFLSILKVKNRDIYFFFDDDKVILYIGVLFFVLFIKGLKLKNYV